MPSKTRVRRAASGSNPKRAINRVNILLAAVIVLALAAIFEGVALNNLSASQGSTNAALQHIEGALASLQADYNTSLAAHGNTTVTLPAVMPQYNINGTIAYPPLSLAEAPVITQQAPAGSRLTGINSQLNATALSIINNASPSYFETAGNMYLNGSLVNQVGSEPVLVNPFIVNGKASVLYLGSITCVFCGENRWAMALALSQFGKFNYLYKGYSSFGDGDLPTLYWAADDYNGSSVSEGSFYNSSYINFLPLEDTAPITAGFSLQPLPTIQAEVNSTGSLVYKDEIKYIIELNNFQGTPYTIWGSYQVDGADAVDFGNTTPSGDTLPLTNMTHGQVLQQFAHPDGQFAWTEYAAADFYIALLCKSAPATSAAPVCGLSAIKGIIAKL